MSKSLLELAAEIVQAEVAGAHMDVDAVERALMVVYNTLRRIQAAEDENRTLSEVPAGDAGAAPLLTTRDPMSPAESIQENQVLCLECGAAFRQLTANHLRSHGLTPREYKKKYGFPLKQPLSAKALTVRRSEQAKQRGLPENLRALQARRKEAKGSLENNL